MAHFGFENDVRSATKIEMSLAKAPPMRWERKLTDGHSNTGSKSNALKSPLKPLQQQNIGHSKTPGKTPLKVLKVPGDQSKFTIMQTLPVVVEQCMLSSDCKSGLKSDRGFSFFLFYTNI